MARICLVSAVISLGVVLFWLGNRPQAATTGSRKPVRLAVVVVFDQMRGDYVDKWQPLFGTDGFQRIQTDGAWFDHCHYPYATTTTGPGHSAILSGATLDKTGIINNEWYDRRSGSSSYCAGSDRYQFVPLPKPVVDDVKVVKAEDAVKTAQKTKSVGNPERMLAETVADVLKRETKGKGKVFGLSLKDRSAILPTGKRPDGAFWFTGQFVTSTYYTDVLPKWVDRFNQSDAASKWYKKDWSLLRPDISYANFSGLDNVKGESNINGQGITFPHPMTGGKLVLGKEYYEALANSPYGNELLLEFAKSCIENEKLGQDDIPDLLVVSFSSNDLIGHTFGPDSQEVLDATLRSDLIVADLLNYLNNKVGAGRYSLSITADHGVCPLPEVAVKQGKDAKRISVTSLMKAAEQHLRDTYGKPDAPAEAAKPTKAGIWLESASFPWMYLNERNAVAKDVKPADVAETLAVWLRKQPDIVAAYSTNQLQDKLTSDDPICQMAKRSYFPGRSGDVYVVMKPYYLISDPVKGNGTTHGSPHDYDRHVPLMVYGPGVKAGRHNEPTTPQHTAAITAYYLGIPAPKDCMYPVPQTLLER